MAIAGGRSGEKRVSPGPEILQSTWRSPEIPAVRILVRKVGAPFLLMAASLEPIDQAAAMGDHINWRNAFLSRKKSLE